MGVLGTYYFEGTSFADAYRLWSDEAMTYPASNGFYSQFGVVREIGAWGVGVLMKAFVCSDCEGASCQSTITNLGSNIGKMVLEIKPQTTLGAMFIYFTPGVLPSKVTWTASVSGYSDPVGVYASTEQGYVTGFIGNETATITNASGSNGSTFVGEEYLWNNSQNFWEDTGASSTIPAFSGAGCTLLSTGSMGVCSMPIPYVNPTSVVTITIENCVTNATWGLEVQCPILIPATLASAMKPSALLACAETSYPTSLYLEKYFLVQPQVGDWVFSDAYGINTMAGGYYKIPMPGGIPDIAVEVTLDGVVGSVSDC